MVYWCNLCFALYVNLQGRKWWQMADKPWQTLASCFELAKAVRSPDSETFVSHIPIHQVCFDCLIVCSTVHLFVEQYVWLMTLVYNNNY